MEELFESEVVWPEDGGSSGGGGAARDIGGARSSSPGTASRRARSWPSTSSRAAARPVGIPRAWRATGGWEGEEEGEWTPPHVLASRRRAEGKVAAFSVCSGHGRTLKGRDLRHVRDSVLRMTGFLEG